MEGCGRLPTLRMSGNQGRAPRRRKSSALKGRSHAAALAVRLISFHRAGEAAMRSWPTGFPIGRVARLGGESPLRASTLHCISE